MRSENERFFDVRAKKAKPKKIEYGKQYDLWDDKIGEHSLTEDQMREAFHMFCEMTLKDEIDFELAGTVEGDQGLFTFRFGPRSKVAD